MTMATVYRAYGLYVKALPCNGAVTTVFVLRVNFRLFSVRHG